MHPKASWKPDPSTEDADAYFFRPRCPGSLAGRTLRTFRIDRLEMGWSDLDNGALLRQAQEGFDLFITTDQNLEDQQNLAEFELAILVLPTTSWPRLQGHLDAIADAVDEMEPEKYRVLILPNLNE